MSSYYVQEDDGLGHYTLEDSSGDLILEDEGNPPIEVPFIASTTTLYTPTVATKVYSRVSQAPAEVLLVPSDQKARISQAAVEVLVQGIGDARISQMPAEVLIQNTEEVVNIF